MPQLDQTGPQGLGPKTGRGTGPCADNMTARFGCFRGRGFGCRRFISPKNELVALEEEEKALENELALIKEEKAALKSQEQ